MEEFDGSSSDSGSETTRLVNTPSGVPLLVERLSFSSSIPRPHSTHSSVRQRKKKKSHKKSRQRIDPAMENQRADEAAKALDDFISAQIRSAQKLHIWKELSPAEKTLFILDLLLRSGIAVFMSIFTGLLYEGTGTAGGLKIQQEWDLPVLSAKILEIIADIEGMSSNAVLNSEGAIDFCNVVKNITKTAASNIKRCKSCFSPDSQAKFDAQRVLFNNPDETTSEKRSRLAKSIARTGGKIFFTVASAAVYYFLAQEYPIPTFLTGAAANGLGVSSLTWLNPTLPAHQKAIVDYLKDQLDSILNLLEIDPEEGMKRLRRFREYVGQSRAHQPDAENPFAKNLDLLYFALSMTTTDRDLEEPTKEYLERTPKSAGRNLFAKIVFSISVTSIGGYVYDVVYGLASQFHNLYAKLAAGVFATAAAIPPFYGLSSGAANRVGAEFLSNQASLASLVQTAFLKYMRISLITGGYLLTAGSGVTNWLLNLIFANQVTQLIAGTAKDCVNNTIINATTAASELTAPVFATARDFLAQSAPIVFQNLTSAETCPDQRSWFAIFLANLYAMVGMIGAPVTNLFYWLLMTDNLTVFFAEHGFSDHETKEMIALVKMFRNITSGVENTDPTQFTRILNKIFTPVGQLQDGTLLYSHLAQQLFAILNEKLSTDQKETLSESLDTIWEQLRQDPSLSGYTVTKEQDFREEAKERAESLSFAEGSRSKKGCCPWGRSFSWFRRSSENASTIATDIHLDASYQGLDRTL